MGDVSSYYQDAFQLYMYALGKDNKQVFLPNTKENRETRTKFLNGVRMAWKNNLKTLPKEFRGDMDTISFFSAEDDKFLYVYADKKQERIRLSSVMKGGGDEFDSFL